MNIQEGKMIIYMNENLKKGKKPAIVVDDGIRTVVVDELAIVDRNGSPVAIVRTGSVKTNSGYDIRGWIEVLP